jgi:hypothetical protein
MRRWPSSLPGPIEPGYRLTPVDQSIRTDMEVGARRLRRVSAARRDSVEMTFRFTDAEMAAFRAWFGDEAWSTAGESDSLAAWTAVRATVTADSIVGPDGALADRLAETAVAGDHRLERDLAASVGENAAVVFQATMRAAGRSFVRFGLIDRAATLDRSVIDLATGAFGAEAGLISRKLESRGGGWWRATLVANSGVGVPVPKLRFELMTDATTLSYTGDGISGVDICEVQARVQTGYDLYVPTDANGATLGASGGAGWFLMPLVFGGGFRTVEARFEGPFSAEALSGLNWQVTARMEVRNA